ncbi:hypothetical protein SGFS_067020 [Streptomyces graminofaciens]|uniref:DUF4232 domain-containing protein n=1 Tax=Streptomyces graminofaciens TaxID=68212 RepID=A0ABN5VPL6_9ACTN|nr:hypothetical protein [Streptomyces graminofaciens]BBC35408.1 hypothetical protein SGFS_067020 [Streptomyces graminofaciens]
MSGGGVGKGDGAGRDDEFDRDDAVTRDDVVTSDDAVTSDDEFDRDDPVTGDDAVTGNDAVTRDEAFSRDDESGERGEVGERGQVGSGDARGKAGAFGKGDAFGKGRDDGISGLAGLGGTSGFVGASGHSGPSGLSGSSGLSGASGLSGSSGRSGHLGVAGTDKHDGRASWGRGRSERVGGRALDEHEETQSHAGNGTVNHGPDGFDSDELALRSLLHQTVSDIEPRDGTLDHLRRAVPARRARKRQAVVGMAAAALFVGTAIPALVHVSNSTGSDPNPSVVGHGSQTQGNAGQSKGQSGSGGSSGGDSGASKGSGKDADKDKGDKDKGQSTVNPEVTATAAGAAACTAEQLASAGSGVSAPDSVGAVYGYFRVSNTSSNICTVAGAGGMSLTPGGAADQSKITVADHVAGDAASGLPDPSLSVAQMELAPGAAYVVRFAWVPSEACPTSNSSGGTSGGTDPSPDPTPTDDASDNGGTGTDSGNTVSSQLIMEDGGTADGSVTVSYAAEGGAAGAATTVGNACAGTVYRTGLLQAT